MKALKLSFDFSDQQPLVEMLRMLAAKEGTSQKAIVIDALEAYFAEKLERNFLLQAANQAFREWDNEEDKIYDTI